MTSRTIQILALTLVLILSLNAISYAEVSNATMLFLRIAPGARAAALGEAYVAISDDATTSHWNPAGLGAFPLSSDWLDSEIPAALRPITDVAAVKMGRGSNYLDYELWAITKNGLQRYDNRAWHDGELFSVPSSANLADFVGRYFGLPDDNTRAEVTQRVAVANNAGSLEDLEKLRDSVMSLVPESYGPRARIAAGFDSLTIGYNQCRVDWSYISAINEHLQSGLKDGDLSERELDRVNVAVERAHLRYIKEEIKIPFSTLFSTPPTDLESTGEVLLVASEQGLYQMKGSYWKRLTKDDGLPSENVMALKSTGDGKVIIGTDKGIAVHDGSVIKLLATEEDLPEGEIKAIGANGLNNIWVVLNSDLYHYDGSTWANYFDYTVTIDDNVDAIANRYSLYGTANEHLSYKTKLAGIDQYRKPVVEEAVPTAAKPGETVVVIDSLPAEPTDSAAAEETPAEPEREFVPIPETLDAGMLVRVPYLASFKGTINDICVDLHGTVWFATDYGVVRFSSDGWEMPGWETVTVDSTVSWGTLVSRRGSIDTAFANADETVKEAYLAAVRDINDLPGSPLEEGQVVRLYARPNGYPVSQISRSGSDIYFATGTGLLWYDSGRWRRADFKSLGNANVEDILTIDEEIWFLTDNRVIAKGRGKTEFTLMHSNWLPSLANDLYYDFFGFVTSSDKIGTFGGNVTFISYGTINRRDENNVDLGNFDAFEVAFTFSYGTALSKKWKGGVSAKLIHSHLSDVGTAAELGNGVTWAFALDFGLMYQINPRLNLGLAVTNLGPDVQYSDNPQSDALPRNIALGLAWKAYQSDAVNLLTVAEANKSLVDLGDPRSEEFKEIIWSLGVELDYLKLIALRGGYYHDEVGKVKNVSFGAGLTPMDLLKFDFAYIPSNNDASLANTLRLSLTITP